MPIYHALSLKQPWANLIRDGCKTIETRTWSTSFRGELLLCASKMPQIEPCGCAVCLVEVIDCRPMRRQDWRATCIAPAVCWTGEPRRIARPIFGWHLANIRPVPPIPVRGRLQIFTVELPDLQDLP